jgi:hypothetical protein
VLQEAAEPLATLHLARRERRAAGFAGGVRLGNRKRHVADTLVWAILEIMCDETGDEVVEVTLADHDEVIEALPAQGPDPAFRVRIPLRDRMHRLQTVATERSR